MLKKELQRFVLLTLVLALVSGTACGKKEDKAASMAGKEVILIADPSYSFTAVKAVYPKLDFGKYLDKANSKSDYSDKFSQAVNLGAQIIDCLIAIKVKDFKTAETIAKSLKQNADKLNISAKIEDKAVELQKNIEAKADVKARKNLDELRSLILKALEELSGQELDVAVQFGAWMATYSKMALIVNDNYQANGSTLLVQTLEIDYFSDRLSKGKFKDKESVKKAVDFLAMLKTAVYVKTDKGESVAKDKVAKIASESKIIAGLIKEGK